jgi:hypothetical protein
MDQSLEEHIGSPGVAAIPEIHENRYNLQAQNDDRENRRQVQFPPTAPVGDCGCNARKQEYDAVEDARAKEHYERGPAARSECKEQDAEDTV